MTTTMNGNRELNGVEVMDGADFGVDDDESGEKSATTKTDTQQRARREVEGMVEEIERWMKTPNVNERLQSMTRHLLIKSLLLSVDVYWI